MNRRLCFWCVMALLVWGATLGARESLRIVPIVHGDEVLVSFELADAYTGDVREAISSGLRTTFTYNVELRMVGAALGGSHDRDSRRQRQRPVRQPDEAPRPVADGGRPCRGVVGDRRRSRSSGSG